MGSVRTSGQFKDKVSRKECIELIRLIGHVRVRAIYCLADSVKDAGKAQMLTQLVSQRAAELADVIDQVKEFAHE